MTGRTEPGDGVSYRCLTGHDIADFLRETEEVRLDGGARMRVCREHQAPLMMTKRPADRSEGPRSFQEAESEDG